MKNILFASVIVIAVFTAWYPARSMDDSTGKGETQAMPAAAVFAGGCFWCTEAVFARVKGVRRIVPGYSGGQTMNPTYAQISRGNTGHAEVIQVTFDPGEISLTDLLEIFFVTQ